MNNEPRILACPRCRLALSDSTWGELRAQGVCIESGVAACPGCLYRRHLLWRGSFAVLLLLALIVAFVVGVAFFVQWILP